MADDIFTNAAPVTPAVAAPEETVVALSDLVGEGKKYADEAALAKALLHKDMTIVQREKELAGLRQELSARNRLEEIADRLSQAPEPLPPPVPTDAQGSNKTVVTPEDIAKLVATAVANEQSKAQITANRQNVVDTLKAKLGDDFPEKVRQTVRNLGLTEAEANDVAGKNPKAFFAMLGISDTAAPVAQRPNDGPFAPPRSTASFQPTPAQTKNWDYYESMRRNTDPKVREKYWSVSVQNEIHKMALGNPDPEAFYKR